MSHVSERVPLFRRELRRFTGGARKVRHSFAHAERSTRFTPRTRIAPSRTPERRALRAGTSAPPLAKIRRHSIDAG